MTNPQAQDEDNLPEGETPAHEASADPSATRIAELEKQLAEMKDRALREMADAENTRRRAQKEQKEASQYAVANFAKEMLGISDNFSRALEAVPKDSADPAVKNLVAGVDATDRQLQAVFERFGIKKLDPVGQPFDPNFHQAMMEVETGDYPAGTVVKVLQAGYVIHGRLLREALVAVAKNNGAKTQHVDTSA